MVKFDRNAVKKQLNEDIKALNALEPDDDKRKALKDEIATLKEVMKNETKEKAIEILIKAGCTIVIGAGIAVLDSKFCLSKAAMQIIPKHI